MKNRNKFYYNLKQCKSLRDISNCISLNSLEKFSYILLLGWILLPIFLVFINFVFDRHALSAIWLTFLYLIGFGSLLVSILHVYKKSFKKCRFIILFLFLYMIWAFFSCFFSNNKFLSFIGSEYLQEGFFTYLCYVFLFFNSMFINNNLKKSIFKIFSFICFVMSVWVLSTHYLNFDFNFTRTFTCVFYNENHSAYYFMMGYVCSILCFLFGKEKKSFLYLILSIVILHNLVLNNTLGCYLTVIFILIVILLYCVLIKSNLKKIFAIIIIFVFVSLFDSNLVNRNMNSISNDLTKIKDSIVVLNDDIVDDDSNEIKKNIYKVGTNRIGLWLYGLQFIGEKPIFGYGIENLYEQYARTDVTDLTSRPHNEYIQIGAFMGIPALVFYLCFLCSIYFPILLKIKKVDNCVVISILIAFSYLVSAFFGVSVFYTTPYLFVFLGMTSSYFIENKE